MWIDVAGDALLTICTGMTDNVSGATGRIARFNRRLIWPQGQAAAAGRRTKMRTPAVGDCVVAPFGAMGSFEARIIRVDEVRRQVLASMQIGEDETPFHLSFEDVSRLESAPAKVPNPS